MRHQRTAHAQHVQDVIQRAALFHAISMIETSAEIQSVMRLDKRMAQSVIHRLTSIA
jgi:hypothetical protein